MTDRRSRNLKLLAGAVLVLVIVWGATWALRRARTQSLLDNARQAQIDGDFTRARQLAGEVLELAPRSTEALLLRAEAAEQLGEWAAAAADYERLAEESKPNQAAQAWMHAGRTWMGAMRVREAEARLLESARLDPRRPEPFRLLAQIYSIEGRSDHLIRQLIRLIQLEQHTLDDLIVLGRQAPFIDDAERRAAMLKADPDFRIPLLAVARQAMAEHRFEDAERTLRQIVTAHPGNMEARGLLGSVLVERSSDRDIREWLAGLPPEADEQAAVWLVRGIWLRRAGRNEEAIRCFWESFRRSPEHFAAAHQLGQALAAVGEEPLSGPFFDYVAHARQALDLNSRIDAERIFRWAEPLVDELEASGRLWEAWGWCRLVERYEPRSSWARARAQDLRDRLGSETDRTVAALLPGADVDWARFPLPDWSARKSQEHPRAHAGLPEAPGSFVFEAQGPEIGIQFQFRNGDDPATPGRRIFESTGGGIAVLDFDLDGWPDLYFVQGGDWPVEPANAPSDALFRNIDGQRFEETTVAARLHEPSFGQGVAVGDFDSDGFPDLYIANIGRNRLWHNLGDGTFEDVTDRAGLQSEEWTISCLIADLDGDRDPDLFDANYLQGRDAFEAICTDRDGHARVCRPDVFPAAPDVVAVSRGDGRFDEQGGDAGLDGSEGRGMGLVAADFDGSGRLGLFVANDMSANDLLRFSGDTREHPVRIENDGLLAGVALDRDGQSQACMGVACADLNGDARPELFVTNFAQESNTLYVSQTDGIWLDLTREAGLRQPSFPLLGFGTEFIDADLDGHPDLLVLNGHIDDFSHEGQELHMRPQFFRGLGGIRFSEIAGSELGEYFTSKHLGRGLAVLDWNCDGRPDAAVSHLDSPVALLTNRGGPVGRSLQLRLVGTSCSRDAIGTRVRVQAGGREQHVQLTAGNGYAASHERLLTVGLGAHERADEVEIHWPSGAISRFQDVASGAGWIAIEGRRNLLRIHRPGHP